MWPKNRKFALCLTHDVDKIRKTYQYFTHFARTGRVYHLKSILDGNNPYWCFERLMTLEKKHGVRSTFFFRSKHANKVKEVMKRLERGGWEIGLHPSYNSFRSAALIGHEKRVLEKALGHKVIGVRQHYLNMNENTWRYHKQVGFRYDSTFGFKRGIGFKENKYRPFYTPEGLLEIPLNIMDMNLKDMLSFEKLMKLAKKKNALITIVWHQRMFNEKEFPGVGKKYEQVIEMCKKNGAWITNCKGVYDWIQKQD